MLVENETINGYVVTEEPDAYYVVSILSKAKKPFVHDECGLRLATEFADNLNKRSEEYKIAKQNNNFATV